MLLCQTSRWPELPKHRGNEMQSQRQIRPRPESRLPCLSCTAHISGDNACQAWVLILLVYLGKKNPAIHKPIHRGGN
jgi:hypothetical protein